MKLACTSFALLAVGMGFSTNFTTTSVAAEPEVIIDPNEVAINYHVQGEYTGQLKLGEQAETYGAQVIALGDQKFRLELFRGGLPGSGWKRGDQQQSGDGKLDGDSAEFENEAWVATWNAGSIAFQSAGGDSIGTLKSHSRTSPTLGLAPPPGAKVLFDGTSAEQFQNGEIVMDDLLLANCESIAKFGDHRLHLEFRTPFKPTARGQGRGNSGVYLQSRYEVQVLDSFGLTGENNECGGIYKIAQPLVNACLPPLTWQTYDIDFTAARYEDGKKVANARATVRHNGILIHNNLELPAHTPGKHSEGPEPDGLYLQGHGNPVVYRNIWVQPGTAAADETGYVSLFDGQTLKHWDGDPMFWRVEDGAITGESTPEKKVKANTFLIWRGGEVADFDLKLQYRIVNGNSGIQYRSFELDNRPWGIGGYQADFEANKRYSGILYGEQFRGILADRGLSTVIEANHKPRTVSRVGDSEKIQQVIKPEDWNDYHITAHGYHFVHRINGTITSECYDADESMRRDSGLLALQLHTGPSMVVQFRNIRIRHHNTQVAATDSTKTQAATETQEAAAAKSSAGPKRIVFIAGKKSHGYAAHEHRAGCMLLAKALEESQLGFKTQTIANGWPEDDSVLDGADSIVIYADGGGRHPALPHLERLEQLMQAGTGLVLLHYGVEIPPGDGGKAFVRWTGGYFETFWSVNPHWSADYAELPQHPIANGVQPFEIHDEWYYHMRFREQMRGVTPILTAVPPASTLTRKDGPHSNNPHVRAKQGQPQHMAWATERPDGGRGFGFTGGHVHWNWGHNDFRKLVLNAIAWTAKTEIPEEGIPSRELTVADLEANQDFPPNDRHNPARIQQMLDEWNRPSR